jgi:hypothetical protein
VSEHRGDDIEFDFFDEPETRENEPRRREPRRGGGGDGGPEGGPPRRSVRPPAGFTPLLRLAGLIAFAILIVVLLVLWVQSCQGASKRNAYRHYMEKVTTIGASSEQTGKDFNALFTTPSLKEADVESKLTSFAQQEEQNTAQAKTLTPPGPLRLAHSHLIEALQFRVSGLRGLADAFRTTAGQKADKASSAGQLLATQAERLVASDVVWDDLFTAPATDVLRKEGIGGVAVPRSHFLSNPDLVSLSSATRIWQRLRGATTGGTAGGLHGTGLVSVKALPRGQTLAPAPTENTVTASTDLAFEVTVKDTGNSQEVSIPVTLTIQRSPQNIVKKATIDLINPGESKKVVFRNLGQPPFGIKTTIKVDVQPVPGEKNTGNNSAEYPVVFSLG